MSTLEQIIFEEKLFKGLRKTPNLLQPAETVISETWPLEYVANAGGRNKDKKAYMTLWRTYEDTIGKGILMVYTKIPMVDEGIMTAADILALRQEDEIEVFSEYYPIAYRAVKNTDVHIFETTDGYYICPPGSNYDRILAGEEGMPKDPMIGAEVEVWGGDKETFLGDGKIIDIVTVYAAKDKNGNLYTDDNPEEPFPEDLMPEGSETITIEGNVKIELNNEKIVYGCQTWWAPKEVTAASEHLMLKQHVSETLGENPEDLVYEKMDEEKGD